MVGAKQLWLPCFNPAFPETDIAYSAGILDGEGWIRLQRMRDTLFGLHLGITNNDLNLLLWLKQRWGGQIYKKARYKPQHRLGYDLVMAAQQAFTLLESVCPYLLIKRKQASKALELEAAYYGREAHLKIVRERIYRELKILNQRGVNAPSSSFSDLPPRKNEKAIITDLEVAYASGIFDAEGTIRLRRNLQLSTSVENTSIEMLGWLRERFGGEVHPRTYRNENGRQTFTWELYRYGAQFIFLESVLPYLLIKKKRAEKALELKSCYREGDLGLAKASRAQREKIREELSEMNQRGLQV